MLGTSEQPSLPRLVHELEGALGVHGARPADGGQLLVGRPSGAPEGRHSRPELLQALLLGPGLLLRRGLGLGGPGGCSGLWPYRCARGWIVARFLGFLRSGGCRRHLRLLGTSSGSLLSIPLVPRPTPLTLTLELKRLLLGPCALLGPKALGSGLGLCLHRAHPIEDLDVHHEQPTGARDLKYQVSPRSHPRVPTLHAP